MSARTDAPTHSDGALRDVSVVIASHRLDAWPSLIAALDSINRQTLAPRGVVVAVDHNPELAARLRAHRDQLDVVLNDGSERGASATRNIGSAATTTEIVAFLDDDEVAEPQWLERLVAPLDDTSVVGTGGRYVPNWLTRRPAWFPDELAWVVGAHHTGMPGQVARVRNVWSGNMAVRRTAFDAVGGFRLGFGKVGDRSRPEDTDLCIRMAATVPDGHWIYVPEAKIHHEVPATRSSFAFFVRRCYAEGRGKVDLQQVHDEVDALSTERDYLRTTIPQGLRGYGRDAAGALGRAGAIAVGIAAAGIGAVVSRGAHAQAARRSRSAGHS